MNLVGPLGPDASAAALGKLDEIPASPLDRFGDSVVSDEQAFQRFSGRGTGNGFADRYGDGFAWSQIQSHSNLFKGAGTI
jgi:hypothetical protein